MWVRNPLDKARKQQDEVKHGSHQSGLLLLDLVSTAFSFLGLVDGGDEAVSTPLSPVPPRCLCHLPGYADSLVFSAGGKRVSHQTGMYLYLPPQNISNYRQLHSPHLTYTMRGTKLPKHVSQTLPLARLTEFCKFWRVALSGNFANYQCSVRPAIKRPKWVRCRTFTSTIHYNSQFFLEPKILSKKEEAK